MNDTAFYESLAVWSQVVGAIVFLGVLVWLFVKFVTPAIRASQERANAELAESERCRDEAKADLERARAEVATADNDVLAIGQRAERDAVRERERLLSEAKAEGERVVRNAEGELARGRYAARAKLRSELVDKAVDIAREAAARLDETADQRVIGGVLQAIEKREDGT
jgi:F0F1-type ATP synthase membrane subunit b/b'